MKMAMANSSSEPMEILLELRSIVPDVLESKNRCLILPQTLGGFNDPKYIGHMKSRIRELNRYMDMLNAGLINEMEYEGKKAEILSSIGEFDI